MRLNEFYNPEFDEFQKQHQDDTRKSKMTLETLGKLRKVREVQRAEELEHAKFQKVMYATPVDNNNAFQINTLEKQLKNIKNTQKTPFYT